MEKKMRKFLALFMTLLMVVTVVIPSSAATIATPGDAEPEVQTTSNGIQTYAGNGGIQLYAAGDDYDLGQYVKEIVINEDVNGTWDKSDGQITNGDQIQIEVKYSLPSDLIDKDNNIVTYQLPGNILLDAESSGPLTNEEGEIVGTYIIHPDGSVEIIFDFTLGTIYEGDGFDGTLSFSCKANLEDSQSEGNFHFEGVADELQPEVVIVPSDDAYDVKVEKSASEPDLNDNKVSYELRVYTTMGTRGSISVTDTLSQNDYLYYDEDEINLQVRDADGNLVTDYEVVYDPESNSFTIDGLPQLANDQEYYTIQYDASINEDALKAMNGSEWVNNSAMVQSGNDQGENVNSDTSYQSVEIKHSMLEKNSAQSSSGNGEDTATWTVVVNAAGEDIGGMKLSDMIDLPAGAKIDDIVFNVTVSGDSIVETTITKEDFFSAEGVIFADGDTSTYTITYSYTTSEEFRDKDHNIVIPNKVDMNGEWDAADDGIIGPSEHQDKDFIESIAEQAGIGATYKWSITIRVPDTGLPSGSFTYDELGDHQVITQDTWSIEGLPAGSVVTFFDKDNHSYTNIEDVPAEGAVAFQVDYPDNLPSGEFTYTYTTHTDYSWMNDESFSFVNTASLTVDGKTERDDVDSNTYTNRQSIIKYVYNADQWPNLTEKPNASFYGDLAEGQVSYVISLNQDGSITENLDNIPQNIEVVDILPEGTSYVPESASLNIIYGSSISTFYDQDLLTTEVQDGKLIFIVDKSVFEVNQAIGILYSVKFPNETGSYKNQATCDVAGSASVVQDIIRSEYAKEVVDKALLIQDGQEVTYHVIINPENKDLLPDEDVLQLTDNLKVPERNLLNVTFLNEKLKIYLYDENAPDHKGELLSSNLYSYDIQTNTEKEYNDNYYVSTMTLTVPDELGLVIDYVYDIRYSSSQAANPSLSNDILIAGTSFSKSVSNEYQMATSSATASNAPSLTLYKTQAGNSENNLADAVFKLEEYNITNDSWNLYQKADSSEEKDYEIVIPETGLYFTTNADQASENDVVVKNRTLYKLTEIEAPEGYKLDDTPMYFVFGLNSSSESMSTLREYLDQEGILDSAGIDADANISLIVTRTQASISNKMGDTTVTINKEWQNSDGSAISAPSDKTATISLLQNTMVKEEVPVTITSIQDNGWDMSTQSDTYDAVPGTDFTIGWEVNGSSIDTFDATIFVNGVEKELKVVDLGAGAYYLYTLKNLSEVTDVSFIVSIKPESNGWIKDINVKPEYERAQYQSVAATSTFTDINQDEEDAYDHTYILDDSNGWSILVSDLPTGDDNGKLYYYTIEEVAIEGFTTSYSANNNTGINSGTLIAINTAEEEVLTGDLVLSKENLDGDVLKDATFYLYSYSDTADGNKGKSVDHGTTGDDGKLSFEGLTEGTYVLEETIAPTGYVKPVSTWIVTVDAEGKVSIAGLSETDGAFVIINTTEVIETIDIPVTKEWEDDDNALNKRPASVVVELFQTINDVTTSTGKKLTLNEANNWKGTFKTLPIKDTSGNDITYSIKEATVRFYDPEVSGNQKDGFTLTNTIQNIGSLKVSKTVAGDSGETDKDFVFTIKITLNGKSIVGTFGDYTFDEEGITVTLKDGESITIPDLPDGAKYTVTETDYSAEGYITSSEGADGTIVGGETKEAKFVNTKNVGGSLTIVKKLAGNDTDPDDEFEFTITLKDATGPVGGTFSGTQGGKDIDVTFGADGKNTTAIILRGDESITINGLPTGATYVVEEADYSKDGYVASYTGTGTISKDNPSTVTVTNTKDTFGTLTISKEVKGNAADPKKEFNFTVTLKDGADPVSGTFDATKGTESIKMTFGANGKNETPISLNGGESITITGLPNGVTYTVEEADYSEDGYVLSSKTGATATIVGGNDYTAAFVNTRNANGSLTISKFLVGNDIDPGKEFEFTITLDDKTINGTYSDVTFKSGVATITLKGGESIVIEGLPNGTGYTVEETDYTADGYSANYAGTGDVEMDHASGTISEKSASLVSVTNNRDTYGDLTVKKTVTGNDTEPGKEFAFTVTLDDKTINGYYGDMYFEDGVAEFTLASGDELTAKGLPNGMGYTVEEDDYSSNGYVTTTDDNIEGTIVGDSEIKTVVTNTRDTFGSLTVSKTVVGGDSEKEFSFTVTLSDDSISGTYGDMTFAEGVAIFTLKDGESKTATDLPNGITYTVEEDDYFDDGYTSSSKSEEGTIVGNEIAVAEFLNTHFDFTGSLKLSKTVDGALTFNEVKDSLTFIITSDNGYYREIKGEELTGPDNSITIENLPVGKYVVEETCTVLDGYILTSTEYVVRGFISVIDDDTTATASVLRDQITEVTFVNTYDEETSEEVTTEETTTEVTTETTTETSQTQTGDSAPLPVATAILFVSMGACVVMIRKRKVNSNN